MKALAANIEDVFREAAARWTLLAYFFLSTIFIVIFSFAINLDIVDGALAGAKLFGRSLEMEGSNPIAIEKLVIFGEMTFSGIFYLLCTFLAVFATAHLVPRMQDKGTIDLYLSRPVGRVRLLLSRYLAGLLLAAANVVYLMASVGTIMAWKTGVLHARFFVGGLIILLVIATLLAFSFLVGVITSSTAVAIMTTFGLFIFSGFLVAHDKYAAAVSKDWQAWLIDAMYWVFPKTAELAQATVAFVGAASQDLPDQMTRVLTPAPFLTTAAFGIGCLALASWLFTRKEF